MNKKKNVYFSLESKWLREEVSDEVALIGFSAVFVVILVLVVVQVKSDGLLSSELQ